ncbi:MAG: LytR C-terminal domain-containing protein [Actinobacteria bacterium]|nr:LytR C-terminal domain-containing protein [Actinomycetota bacterium]
MGELKDILINVGIVAGVASIVGLAVLSMLYFSQARDVRRLREWAGREPERAAEVELRAAQIASQAIAQAYESMAMRQSEADAAAQIAQEQGVEISAAPLVPQPTEEHPEPFVHGMEGAADDPEHLAEVAAEQELEVAPEEAVIAAEPVAGMTAEQPPAEPATVGPGEEPPAEVAEPAEQLVAAEAAGAATSYSVSQPTEEHPEPFVHGMEGAADDPEHLAEVAAEQHATPPADVRPSRLAPSTPAAERGQIPLPPLPPLDTSEFLAVNRPLPNVPPDYYSSLQSTGSGSYEAIAREPEKSSRAPMIIASVLVLAFAIVVAATQFGGGEEEPSTASRRAARDQKTVSTSPRDPQVNRPAVTVSVLNGTQTSGLAKIVGDQLIAVGFTETTTGNRNDNVDHATSVVYYAEGSKLEAKEVANELDIDSVEPIDEDTQAAGGAAPVVVVLGADIEQ